MDTRAKIVPSFATSHRKIVAGYFDPLHAGHIRRLQEICAHNENVAVIVADPPSPILSTAARAELVASLECVAQVIAAGPDADIVIARLDHVIDERPADAVRAREFAQHVLARHNTK